MKNKVLGTVMGAALLAGSSVAVAENLLATENFSGNVAITTDYTFRGTTFSNEETALQGGFDWGNGPWFAGVWASSQIDLDLDTNFAIDGGGGATIELDYYFGWADNVAGLDLMVMPLWYTYPGQESGGNNSRDDLTFELWTSVGMGFDNIPGSPYVTVGLDYSPGFFDRDVFDAGGQDSHSSLHSHIGVAFTLPAGFGLDFFYGKQDVGGKNVNDYFPDDWSYYTVGITKEAAGFGFDVRYHDMSSSDADSLWAGTAKEGELELTVSRSF